MYLWLNNMHRDWLNQNNEYMDIKGYAEFF